MFSINRFVLFVMLLTTSFALRAELPQEIYSASHNSWGWPALHYALFMKHEKAADWLLEKYPDMALQSTPDIKLVTSTDFDNRRDYDYVIRTESGMSALEIALMQKNRDAALKILQYPVDVNTARRDSNGEYITEWLNENYTIVHERVKKVRYVGWDPKSNPDYNYQIFTPLYWAILTQEPEIVDSLFAHDVALNHIYISAEEERSDYSWEAVLKGTWRRLLITKDLNAIDTAVLWGNKAIVKKLLAYQLQRAGKPLGSGEEIPEVVVDLVYTLCNNPHGNSALFQAFYANDVESFELLLDYSFDPHVQDRSCRSLFDLALENSNPAFKAILMRKYPESSFLLEAVKHEQVNTVMELLEQGIYETQALIEAMNLGNDPICLLLLEHESANEQVVDLIVQKNNLVLFKKIWTLGWPLSPKVVYDAIHLKAGNILTELVSCGYAIDPGHYLRCVSENNLDALKQFIDAYGLPDDLKEELILAALEQNREEIFSYLLLQ